MKKSFIFMGERNSSIKSMSDDFIKDMLLTKIGSKSTLVDDECVPPECEIRYPNTGSCCDLFSMYRIRWCNDPILLLTTNRQFRIMPWDWEFTVWIPTQLIASAVNTFAKEIWPNAVIDNEEYLLKQFDCVLRLDKLFSDDYKIECNRKITEFKWIYEETKITTIIPSCLVLASMRGCLAEAR